jgi:hypothetical protein
LGTERSMNIQFLGIKVRPESEFSVWGHMQYAN